MHLQHDLQTVQVVESFEVSENPRDPDVLAQEIVKDLEAALEQFREIANHLIADVPTEKDSD